MKISNKAYSGQRLPVHLQNLRDRISGQSVRANARMGYLNAPEGSGKLIWLRAGQSRYSVRAAAELLAALRERRQDVRLVLTYQEEYPDILQAALQGIYKMGFAYGPCDIPAVVKRTLKRLQPLGVIHVANAPGPVLTQQLRAAEIRSVTFPPHSTPESHLAVRSLWSETQIEPTLGGLIRGGGEAPSFWWHGVEQASVHSLLEQWCASSLGKSSYLYVSNKEFARLVVSNSCPTGCVATLSSWRQTALALGSVIVVDEARWAPAVAASVTACHIEQGGEDIALQLMALGKPASMNPAGNAPVIALGDTFADIKLQEIEKVVDVFDAWKDSSSQAFAARAQGDRLRQAFWRLRRQATQDLETLLQQVYDW